MMQNALQKKQVAAEVAGALAPEVRELTVTITVKARVADDSSLAPLVAEALQELIKREPDTETGEFETKAGLDVSWVVKNEYLPSLAGH
jgi:hypothetical protein